MRRAALAAIILLAACGHAPPVHRPGESFVAAIEFHGNHAIKDDDLLAGMALEHAYAEGRGVDPYELQQDTQRIEGLYDRRGYFSVRVTARVDRQGLAETPVFTIDEGARASLARVEISGLPDDPAISADRIRRLVPIADGAPFDYDAYDDAKRSLLLAVEDVGYARAKLNATVIADRAHREAVIRLEYAPGPRCVFGAVMVRGVEGPLATAALARAPITPGARYSTTAIAAARGAIYDMGRFATVGVDPELEGGGTVIPVTIELAMPDKHNEIHAGLGVGIDQLQYLLQPHIGYSRPGWPESLTTFAADATLGVAVTRASNTAEPRVQSGVTLTRIDLGRPRLTGQVALQYQYLAVEAYTSTGPRVRLGLTTPIGIPQVQAHVGAEARYLRFYSISSIVDTATRAQIHIDAPEKVAAFDESLVADFRDDPFEPRSGWYAAMRAEQGLPAFPGAAQFVELAPDLRGYLPLWRFVLSAHARLGAFWGEVPATERFYGGGASSQRGFAERALSPSATSIVNGNEASVVIGGAGEIETGAELRTTVYEVKGIPLLAAIFLDGGDVTSRVDALDPTNLHWAAGGGLRFASKYGTARIDVGYRLNRYGPGEPEPGSRRSILLGFGEAF